MTFEESTGKTAYAVICPHHGRVYLTKANYDWQMSMPGRGWECPRFVTEPVDTMGPCGAPSEFDDDTYEAAMFGETDSDDRNNDGSGVL